MRPYLQNARGINIDLLTKLMSISDNARKIKIDITFLQEVKNTLPRHNRQKITRALSQNGKQVKLAISTFKTYHNRTTHQLGGNLFLISTQAHRELPSNSNLQHMGQWAVVTLNYPKYKVTGS